MKANLRLTLSATDIAALLALPAITKAQPVTAFPPFSPAAGTGCGEYRTPHLMCTFGQFHRNETPAPRVMSLAGQQGS